MIKIKKISI